MSQALYAYQHRELKRRQSLVSLIEYASKRRRFLAIAPLAWSAATEKLDKADKARLNAARKTARSRNR